MMVLWKQLRRGIVQRRSLQAFNFSVSGNEAFRVVAHAEGELVDDIRVDHAHPVRRPAVVFVEIMRIDAPAIVVVTGPARSSRSEVIGSPPLILPIDCVVVRRLNIEAEYLASLGHVSRALKHVIESAAAGAAKGVW